MTFSIADIPEFTKPTVAVVTGGTGGIGKVAVRELYNHGATIYVIARNASKAEALISEVVDKAKENGGSVTIIKGDHMDLNSIVSAAHEIAEKETKIDILLNNAGIMMVPYVETSDGYESHLQVNYISHYLLTRLLMPLLQAAEAPRIINVSSIAHTGYWRFNFEHPNLKGGIEFFKRGMRYSQSKICNILFTNKLAKLYPSILCLSVHPGVIVDTGLMDAMIHDKSRFGYMRLFARINVWFGRKLGSTIEQGALTSIYCAVDKGLTAEKNNGEYYVPIAKKAVSSSTTRNPVTIDRLWDWTEEQLISKGYWPKNETA
ncbi:hypothetical protein V1512DRAFT_268816 [Lipomyces arxii]|uniref:uncharacterized protein n=1 Tax=Lipomyces arxii TaxID=56418 RepID=UPI0034CEB1D2